MLPFAPGDAVQALRAEYALELHGLPLPKGDEKA
jgi:HPr kinase/phosphorylase